MTQIKIGKTQMDFIPIALDIANVTIKKIEQAENGTLMITIENNDKFTFCNCCGKKISKRHDKSEELILRHLPILDNEVYIKFSPVRYICEECDNTPTTTEKSEWFNKRSSSTKAYEKYILKMLINSTILDVSRKENISYGIIEGIIDRNIKEDVDWLKFEGIKILGMDEISLKKGHKNFVTIVSTKVNDRVKIISILKDRKKATIKQFLHSIPKNIVNTIETFCSDMYDGFVNSAEEVFGEKVSIVVDRFHVAKMYRSSVDTLRKSELKRLKKILHEDDYKKLKGAMWALRKNENELNEKEIIILNNLFSQSLPLKQAYELSNTLTNVFNNVKTVNQAKISIAQWVEQVKISSLKCFDKFLNTLENNKKYITNYFIKRNNSGFVEGLNNKIKVIKRRCYGIFNLKHLFQRIQLDLNWLEQI